MVQFYGLTCIIIIISSIIFYNEPVGVMLSSRRCRDALRSEIDKCPRDGCVKIAILTAEYYCQSSLCTDLSSTLIRKWSLKHGVN